MGGGAPTAWEVAWSLWTRYQLFGVPLAVSYFEENGKQGKKLQPLAKYRDIEPSDEAMERAWSGHEDAPGLGLLLRQSGLVVLDTDTEAAEAWVRKKGVPRTPTVRSRRGFKWILRGSAEQSAGDLHPGVDVAVGLVPLPPTDGYGWVPSLALGEVEIAPAPAWLNGAKRKRRHRKVEPVPETIPEGQREATLVSLAGSMRARGATPQAIRAALGETNRQCVPPLAAADLDRIARSAGTWEPGPAHDPGRYFNREDGFVPARLGAEVKAAARLRVGADRRLWRYQGGVYLPDGDDFVREFARGRLGERYKRRHADEVLAWCSAEFPSIPERPDPRLLNVGNGLLDPFTGELRPHDPQVPSIVQVPVRWDPLARCPGIDRFLSEVLPEDAVELAHEIAGYCLYPAQPLRRAVLLLGSGGNGKSVFLRVLRALVGERNVSTVPLQALGESRFAAAELYGRLANLCGDLDARALRRSDVFKTLTGGTDAVMAERKYRDPFTFVPFATMVFSANEAPLSADQTDAYFDRWIVLPFDVRFDEHGTGEGLEATRAWRSV